LNIVVCGKVIPASSVTIEIDPNTKRMVRKGVTHELDPAAASAVEEGLRLTEKHGGTVTLITMGISEVSRSHQEAAVRPGYLRNGKQRQLFRHRTGTDRPFPWRSAGDFRQRN
jgi:electron transfer flavoprotein alpha/beta subunit